MGHVLAVALACCSAPLADWDFARALDALTRTDTRAVPRAATVVSYKVFIADNSDHPYVALAMLELANLYQHHSPATGLHADPVQASRWLERAASVAPRGSMLWLKVHERLASHCTHGGDAKRAASILDDIAKSFPDDSLALARVEAGRLSLAQVEGRADDMFRHAQNLFGWYDDPTRIPKDGYAKWELDTLLVGAGSQLVESLRQSSLPAPGRRAKLELLRKDYAWLPHMLTAATAALAEVPE